MASRLRTALFAVALLTAVPASWLAAPSAWAQVGVGVPAIPGTGTGALTAPRGSSTGQMVDQIERSVTRPVPSVPSRPAYRDPMIWVPDRWVRIPGEPAPVHVPGHWERRLPSGDVHVPPLTVQRPSTGTFETFPGGVKPPVEQRQGP